VDRKTLELFRQRLVDYRHNLESQAARKEEGGRSLEEDSAADIGDRASNTYTKELLFSQSSSQRGLLQMVDAALDRIREGTFGECLSCGEMIGPKRLDAVPWARYCIDCQSRIEEGRGQEQTVSI
jgi:DnaK suppressor protein